MRKFCAQTLFNQEGVPSERLVNDPLFLHHAGPNYHVLPRTEPPSHMDRSLRGRDEEHIH
jgi:hypothetical protein